MSVNRAQGTHVSVYVSGNVKMKYKIVFYPSFQAT